MQPASDIAESKSKLAADFKNLVSDAEEMLKTTATQSGEGLATARARLQDKLGQMRDKLADAQDYAVDRYKYAAGATDRYVRDNPWQAVGIAVAVGVLIGVFSQRR
jgi:ElaB/YqjD/DUF883 family membrane-anchored ribosome-binding protein